MPNKLPNEFTDYFRKTFDINKLSVECPNCGKKESHYIPSSTCDSKGFYTCKPKNKHHEDYDPRTNIEFLESTTKEMREVLDKFEKYINHYKRFI